VRLGGITFERALFRGPVAPSESAPTCAKKDDSWFDTSTNTARVAAQETPSDPLVWEVDTSVTANQVGLNTDAPPTLGSMIVGTADGQWTLATGIDASSIISGVIDPDRVPVVTPVVPPTFTIRADATDYSMPASASFSEITSSQIHRIAVDLTNVSEMKIHFQQTAIATTTPRIEVQYSLNNGSSWTTTNVSGTFSSATAIIYIQGAWTGIPAAAKAPVLLRVGTIGGNGSESPDVANIYISVR
jgi:hypothetical protein